jgi:hypothetical protein
MGIPIISHYLDEIEDAVTKYGGLWLFFVEKMNGRMLWNVRNDYFAKLMWANDLKQVIGIYKPTSNGVNTKCILEKLFQSCWSPFEIEGL